MRTIESAKKPPNPFKKEVIKSTISDEEITKLIIQFSTRIVDKAKHRLFALSDSVNSEHNSLQVEIDLTTIADNKPSMELILNILEEKLKATIRMEFGLVISDLRITIQLGSITKDINGVRLSLKIDFSYNYSELFKSVFFFKTPEGQTKLGIRIKHLSLAKLSAKKISELINSYSTLVEEYDGLNLDQNNIEINENYVAFGLIDLGFNREWPSLLKLFVFVQKVLEKFDY